MGVRAEQVEKGQRGALRVPAFHGAVHGDDGHHLEVAVPLVGVVESTEGAHPRGFTADQHAVKRQHVCESVSGVPAAGRFDASAKRGGVDSVRFPPAEHFREGPEYVGGVLFRERGRVGTHGRQCRQCLNAGNGLVRGKGR